MKACVVLLLWDEKVGMWDYIWVKVAAMGLS
jgi:hypothetical protein